MRVGRSCKRNPFFDRELDDAIARIKLINRFAPAGGGKFDREIARSNEIESLVDDRSNVAARPVSVDLNQIKMRQTIDQTCRGDVTHPMKVVLINLVDAAPDKLSRTVRHAVEHLRRVIEVVD